MIEKERKFLPIESMSNETVLSYKNSSKLIKQAYLLLGNNGQQLRVRLFNNKAYICYKYQINSNSKEEFEYEIPYNDGIKLYNSSNLKLEKYRYSDDGNGEFKIDIDFYKNGLMIIELEYVCSDEKLDKYIKLMPYTIGKEVTGLSEYSNITLAKELSK